MSNESVGRPTTEDVNQMKAKQKPVNCIDQNQECQLGFCNNPNQKREGFKLQWYLWFQKRKGYKDIVAEFKNGGRGRIKKTNAEKGKHHSIAGKLSVLQLMFD